MDRRSSFSRHSWAICVNTLSSINSLHRNQNTYVRRDLNHPSISRQARRRLTQSRGADPFHWIRILPPLADSNSIMQPFSGGVRGALSSTNAGGCLASEDGNSAEPLLQPHITQPKRVRHWICAMLPGQFHCGLPQRLWQLHPPRLSAAKLSN
jgi:hypothetical protein